MVEVRWGLQKLLRRWLPYHFYHTSHISPQTSSSSSSSSILSFKYYTSSPFFFLLSSFFFLPANNIFYSYSTPFLWDLLFYHHSWLKQHVGKCFYVICHIFSLSRVLDQPTIQKFLKLRAKIKYYQNYREKASLDTIFYITLLKILHEIFLADLLWKMFIHNIFKKKFVTIFCIFFFIIKFINILQKKLK